MNRHDSYQQPEATANNANAKQWQVDLSERDASKVGNDSDAGGVNDGKDANDTNHTSDQGETVEVRVIKGDRDEPNDRPGQVEQGSQAGQTVRTGAEDPQYGTDIDPGERSGQAVRTGTETQPKKRGIIELLGSSPLGVMAQTAFDSVRHSVHEIQVDRQIKLIDRTVSHYNGDEAQQDYNQLNQLVDEGKIKLSDGRVLKEYLERIDRASSGEVADSNTEFVNKFIQEDKIDLSKSEAREVYLKVALSTELDYERLGVQEAINTGKLDLSNEEIADQFLGAMSQSAAFDTSILKKSSISPERIVNNDHIQEIAVEQMVSVADRVRNGNDAESPIFSLYRYQTVIDGGAYLADVLEKVCSSEGGRQCLVDSINKSGASVQELGELFEKMETDILEDVAWRRDRIEGGKPFLNADLTEDAPSDVDELFANMVTDISKYNGVLKKLGWEPFKDDTSLAELFDHGSAKQSEAIQRRANQLGLITPEVTDRLYTYQYHKLLNKAKKGKVDGETGYTIDPDLTPSGNDLIANYWYEQSKLAGGDAMRLCMEYTSDAIQNDDIPDTSEFIKEDGTMQDAFFRNRKGSLLQDIYASPAIYASNKEEEVMKLLEAHENQASEADGSKAMINMLSKMKDEDGKYDIEAMNQLQLNIG